MDAAFISPLLFVELHGRRQGIHVHDFQGVPVFSLWWYNNYLHTLLSMEFLANIYIHFCQNGNYLHTLLQLSTYTSVNGVPCNHLHTLLSMEFLAFACTHLMIEEGHYTHQLMMF